MLRFLPKLLTLLALTLTLPFRIVTLLFGRISWVAPSWLSGLVLYARSHPKRSLVVGSVLIALNTAAVYQYSLWLKQPKPPKLVASATIENRFERINQYSNSSAEVLPAPLVVSFSYRDSYPNSEWNKATRMPLADSYAALNMLDRVIPSDVSISPAVQGEWRWRDPKTLIFTPIEHWQPGQAYTVSMGKSLFAPNLRLYSDQVVAKTDLLRISVDEFRFYQDPVQPSVKTLQATIVANYPLSLAELDNNLSLSERTNASQSGNKAASKAVSFSLKTDKTATVFYLTSKTLTLPEQTTYADLTIKDTILSSLGGAGLDKTINAQAIIPDIYSLLRIVESSSQIIFDESKTPHQAIMLEFTDAISHQELSSKLKLFRLPKQDTAGKPLFWRNANDVPLQYLNQDRAVAYELSNTHLKSTTSHVLRVSVDPDQQLYLSIDRGLTSANFYTQKNPYIQLITAPAYPKQLYFAESGMMLSTSNTPAIGIGSRGIEALKVSIGKVDKSQLVHLITQTNGELDSPQFQSWSFNESNIADFSSEFLPLAKKPANELNQSMFSFEKYLPSQQLGLFFVKAQAYRDNLQRPEYGVQDTRLLLITDLGLLIKHNNDGSARVFVQSIKTGKPVSGASVEFLAKNGSALFTLRTDTNGVANLQVTRDQYAQQSPTVILVEHKGDSAFLPFNRYTNMIDYSNMDSGGVSAYRGIEKTPKSYMFSDRGIYRPGEQINVASIIKYPDLSGVASIPVEWVMRDPEYRVVESGRPTLEASDNGLLAFDINTTPRFLTGRYQISMHLLDSQHAKNNKGTGRQIGSVNVEVQAFEPDTLKISTAFTGINNSDGVKLGWLSNKQIHNRVELLNLFGTPASAHRTQGEYQLTPTHFTFDAYKEYKFQSHSNITPNSAPIASLSSQQVLPAQTTDGLGVAQYELTLPETLSGNYLVNFTATGYVPNSGRSVVASSQVLYSELDKLVGFRIEGNPEFLKQNQPAAAQLIAIDQQLRTTDYQDLTLTLSEQKTVSTLVKQSNGTYVYQDQKQTLPISSTNYTLPSQEVELSLDTQNLGDYILEISHPSGRVLFRLSYSVIGDGQRTTPLSNGNQLVVRLDKRDYKSGDTVQVSIDAPYTGSGLITIESDKVHASKWFTADTNSSVHDITVPAGIEGTAYINVSYIRAFDSTASHVNPFSYALVPFSLDRTARELDVSLNVARIINPQRSNTVDVVLSQPAKYIVYAVDQGILQVSDYQAPNPLDYYLQKRALGVNTYQMLDMLLPDIKLTPFYAAAGGDMMADLAMRSGLMKAESASLNPFARKVSNPAVFWSGVQNGDAGVNQLDFDLPNDFAGELTFFVVAVSEDKIGTSQTKGLVRGDFVIRSSVPWHMSSDDKVVTSLNVTSLIDDTSLLNNDGTATVEVSIAASPHLIVEGKDVFSNQLSTGQVWQIPLSFRATDIFGNATLTVSVTAISENGLEQSATQAFDLSVRPSTRRKASLVFGQADETITVLPDLKLRTTLAEQTLVISPDPAMFINGIQRWIKQDEGQSSHNLINQLTSIIALPNNLSQSDEQHYKTVLEQLLSRQTSSGGFTIWDGASPISTDVSLRALALMYDMRNRGYKITAGVIERTLAYATAIAQNSQEPQSSSIDISHRAHAIYLLTRNGQITTNFIVDLLRYIEAKSTTQEASHYAQWQSQITGVYIAASYQLMQQHDKAKTLIGQYKWQSDIDDYDNRSRAGHLEKYSLAHDADYLTVMLRHFQDLLVSTSSTNRIYDAKRFDVPFKRLLSSLYKSQFNQRSAAQISTLLYHYHRHLVSAKTGSSISNQLPSFDGWQVFDANQPDKAMAFEVSDKATANYPVPLAMVNYAVDTGALLLSPIESANNPIFYQNYQSGFEAHASNEAVKAVSRNIEITRSFVGSNGEQLDYQNLPQGQAITVNIRLRSLDDNTHENVEVVDLLPSGFVIEAQSVQQTTGRSLPRPHSYHNVREDRMISSLSATPQITKYSYRVIPTIKGQFVLPQLTATHPLNREVFAASSLMNIQVVEQPTIEQ